MAPWTMKEGAELYMKALIWAIALVFLGMNCLVLYGWLVGLSAQ